MSSYSLVLISLSFLGVCSCTIWLAVSLRYISQSRSWMGCVPEKGYCATLHASTIRIARRRFRPLFSAILVASWAGSTHPSFLATAVSTEQISSCLGAATRTARHRDLMAGMTLLVELVTRMTRQVAMYFSMVLLSACWASFVSLSTSVSTTTLNSLWPSLLSWLLLATVLMSSWITTLS